MGGEHGTFEGKLRVLRLRRCAPSFRMTGLGMHGRRWNSMGGRHAGPSTSALRAFAQDDRARDAWAVMEQIGGKAAGPSTSALRAFAQDDRVRDAWAASPAYSHRGVFLTVGGGYAMLRGLGRLAWRVAVRGFGAAISPRNKTRGRNERAGYGSGMRLGAWLEGRGWTLESDLSG